MRLLDDLLLFEKQFQAFLRPRVATAFSSVRDRLYNALADGDLTAAVQLLSALPLAEYTDLDKKRLRVLHVAGLRAGDLSVAAQGAEVWLRTTGPEAALVDKACDHFRALEAGIVRRFAVAELEGALAKRQRAAEAVEAVLFKAGLQPVFKNEDPDWDAILNRIDARTQQGADLAANMTSSRLVNYGALYRMRAERVTEYRLRATLDLRTSRICRSLHNKKFLVKDGLERLERALTVEDPEELRVVHPWVPNTQAVVDELQRLKPPQLQARGINVPPFHPYCRTIVVRARSRITVDASLA